MNQVGLPAPEVTGNGKVRGLVPVRGGVLEAFEEFVHPHQARLYNVIYRMCFDESETRDVLQDTFLNAFRNLENFRGDSKLGTWLHRIAVNTFLRRKSRYRLESLEELSLEEFQLSPREAMHLRSPTPEEAFEEKEGWTVLERAIARLPEKYRIVLVLRDQEGQSAAAVAETLGISIPAVKSRLHRARLFVRRELERLTSLH